MFTMRFDMRAPDFGAPATDLYSAALDMAAYADEHGCLSIVLCEHHGIEDGYLPSPVTMAAAVAARTSTTRVTVAAVLLPLYDPLRLAEDMAVIDHISRGRVAYVGGVGARPTEFEMMGADFANRGKAADEKLAVLLAAKTGEPFELDGRTVQITPRPFTPGGPLVMWGGGSKIAARRAGRNGIGFYAQAGDSVLGEIYEQAARDAGHEPAFYHLPPRDMPTTTFIADDLDEAWDELGEFMMHDVLSYAAWYSDNPGISSTSFATSAEELRAENKTHRILTVDQAVERIRGGNYLGLHPLVGGLPPEIAWKYLRNVTEKVLPALAG